MSDTHTARCFCGAVTVDVTGAPVAQGFCHCNDCRAWSASPVTAYALWPAPQVKVTEGEDLLGEFTLNGANTRRHCTRCGGNVMSVINQAGLIDVYPALMPAFGFAPEAHVQYASRVIDMKDGLPKFADFPEPFGGSGKMVDE